jgi:hypothetical protein
VKLFLLRPVCLMWELEDKVDPLSKETKSGLRAASAIAVIPKPGSTRLQMATSVVAPSMLLVHLLKSKRGERARRTQKIV